MSVPQYMERHWKRYFHLLAVRESEALDERHVITEDPLQ
jgi:hypothetical protein